MTSCQFAACDKTARCRGWCSAHYERWRKYGDPSIVLDPVPPPKPIRTQSEVCLVDACESEPWAKNLCSPHYQKLRKYGSADAPSHRKTKATCRVDTCVEHVHGHHLCTLHYTRQRKHGDVERITRRLVSCEVVGCDQTPAPSRARHCESHYQELFRYGSIGGTTPCADCAAPLARGRKRCGPCAYSLRLRMSKDQGHRRRVIERATRTEIIDCLRVYRRDQWRCGLCDLHVDSAIQWPHPLSPSLDHIVPLVHGGTHTYENVQLAHLRCNVSKGARIPA